jgi:NitT/TauT family transport system permease protein
VPAAGTRRARRSTGRLLGAALLLAALALVAIRLRPSASGAPAGLAELPGLALRSLARMSAAYLLSLFFALAYGAAAAHGQRSGRVLLPVLDVLQSIPVLGFFPVAVAFFAGLLPGAAGMELASVFLIFTGMAWNMAFGVYDGLTTIPADLAEAAAGFGVAGRLRAMRLLFPAAVPKLVYNSIVSWAGGWYFLIACEIISVGGRRRALPGLGSYLQATSDAGDLVANAAGLAVLVGLVVALDLALWRPLSAWSERFRYGQGAASTPESSRLLDWWLAARGPRALRRIAAAALRAPLALLARAWDRLAGLRPPARRALARISAALGLAGGALLALAAARGIARLAASPWPARAAEIPLALLASTGRLLAAYALALAWTVPVAVWAGWRPRAARVVRPLAEIGASVPAIALFPLMVAVLVRHIGVSVAAVLLVLTGMQWYLLFNGLAGVSAIPEDLREATRSLGLPWRMRLRKLVLPAAAPSLVTGSITGWGGGWNALIVSEQLSYAGVTYSAFGIGAILDDATYRDGGDPLLLALCLAAMVAAIAVLNRLVWRRLQAWAAETFRIE